MNTTIINNETTLEIPKIFHFIWIGGPLPEEYLLFIRHLALAAKENKFEVNLWVDNEKNILQPVQKLLNDNILMPENKILLGIHIRNTSEVIDKLKKDRILFSTRYDYEKLITCITREMIGNKNLAAAADIWRYLILFFWGGYYSDIDNKFDLGKLKDLLSQKFIPKIEGEKAPLSYKSAVIIGNYEAKHTGENKYEIETYFDIAGNDFICSISRHCILKKVIVDILKKYQEFDNTVVDEAMKKVLDFKLDKNATLMDAKRYPNSTIGNTNKYIDGRLNLTIQLTGPKILGDAVTNWLVNSLVTKEEAFSLSLEKNNKIFKFASLNCSSGFHNTWLKKTNKRKSFTTDSLPNGFEGAVKKSKP